MTSSLMCFSPSMMKAVILMMVIIMTLGGCVSWGLRWWSWGRAHKLPRENTPISAVFYGSGICSFHNIGSGSASITTPVSVFGRVCASKNAFALLHVPGTLLSHALRIGWHWKIDTPNNAIHHATTTPATTHRVTRKRLEGNTPR